MQRALEVVTTRGPVVETRHEVAVVAVRATGGPVLQFGDADLVAPVRSTVKPMQALPLLRSGAAAAFALDVTQLALACGSHSGEEVHRNLVAIWLRQLDLDEGALQCGSAEPLLPGPAAAFLAAGLRPTPLAHNCSGKHAGFLTQARQLGMDPARYLDPSGPVQQQALAAVAETCGLAVTDVSVALDGCGAPVACLPLVELARGAARMASAAEDSDEARLLRSMAAHPELVAGNGRLDTTLLRTVGPRVVTKAGADGIHVAYLRETGTGVVAKALSGDRIAAELGLLRALEELDGDPAYVELQERTLHNGAGAVVGVIRIRS